MKTLRRLFLILSLCLALLLTSGTAQFNFVHISDIHVSDVASIQNSPDIGGVIFKKVITVIRNLIPKPAFVVASGDISNVGSYGNGMYAELTKHLFPNQIANPGYGDYYIDSAMTIPIYFVPGNHDYFTLPASPVSEPDLINYSNAVAPASDYSINYQNATIIFLLSGSEVYRPVWIDTNPLEPEGSGLTDDQIIFTRNTLNNNISQKKIIVMHHPAVNAHGTNIDGTPTTSTILDPADGSINNNRDIFLNICDSLGVDMVLAGHNHQSLVADRQGNVVDENFSDGTRFIQTAACLYGGYRVITVDSSFVWAGQTQDIAYAGINNVITLSEANPPDVYFSQSSQNIFISFNEVSNSTIAVFNVIGQEVYKVSENFKSEEKISFSTSNLPRGVYLVSISNNVSSYSKKVVIN